MESMEFIGTYTWGDVAIFIAVLWAGWVISKAIKEAQSSLHTSIEEIKEVMDRDSA